MSAERPVPAASAERQRAEIVDRLVLRYRKHNDLHRDVIEAAVLIGWTKYEGARVTAYRSILAERAAATVLQKWFGSPDADVSTGLGPMPEPTIVLATGDAL